MQEAASFQSASYQQKFDTGEHRMVMVKDLDVHFDGKITDPFSTWSVLAACHLQCAAPVMLLLS